MAGFATIVALLSLGTVSAQVTKPAAGVASFLAVSSWSVAKVVAVRCRGGTVAGDVADLSTFVALLPNGATCWASNAGGRAITSQVTGFSATVTCLFASRIGALARYMAVFTTVVAFRCALRRTIPGLVGGIAAVVTSASRSSSTTVVHIA